MKTREAGANPYTLFRTCRTRLRPQDPKLPRVLGRIQLGVGEADQFAGKVVRRTRWHRNRQIERLTGRDVRLLIQLFHTDAFLARRVLAVGKPDAEARRLLAQPLVESGPVEGGDDLRVSSRNNPECCRRGEIERDPQILVSSPTHANVSIAVHSKQAAGCAQHEIAERVSVSIVVKLEAIVIGQLDAEALSPLVPLNDRQDLFLTDLAKVQQRAPTSPNPGRAAFDVSAFRWDRLRNLECAIQHCRSSHAGILFGCTFPPCLWRELNICSMSSSP